MNFLSVFQRVYSCGISSVDPWHKSISTELVWFYPHTEMKWFCRFKSLNNNKSPEMNRKYMLNDNNIEYFDLNLKECSRISRTRKSPRDFRTNRVCSMWKWGENCLFSSSPFLNFDICLKTLPDWRFLCLIKFYRHFSVTLTADTNYIIRNK